MSPLAVKYSRSQIGLAILFPLDDLIAMKENIILTIAEILMELSLTIVIPAYNESLGIIPTLTKVKEACQSTLRIPYEVVVANDCSTDDTLEKVQKFAETFPQLRVVTTPKNLGFGGAFRTGLDAAKMGRCMVVCADDGIDVPSMQGIFAQLGQADVIIPYYLNPECRSFFRLAISWLYIKLINLVFGLNLRYCNGPNVFPIAPVRRMKTTSGFAFSAQIIVRLLKSGYSYVEGTYVTKQRPGGETYAFRPKNMLSVVKSLALLWKEVYIDGLDYIKIQTLQSPSKN